MTTRREFLQAAAITSLPALGGAAIVDAAGTSASGPSVVQAVLVDERHAAARAAGARLAERGVKVHALPRGDITHVWLHHIGPMWQRQPIAVAGLTEAPAMFCLEQFAFASGLRVVFHGEHVVYPGGGTEHRLLRGGGGRRSFRRRARTR